MSGEFEGFLKECGIEHRKSPPLWPQANGEVERQNRTLLKSMKIAAAEGTAEGTEISVGIQVNTSSLHWCHTRISDVWKGD